MKDSFTLNLTGRMSVIIELEDHGPIEIKANDRETVIEVIRVLMGGDQGVSTVDSYGKRAGQRLRKVLEGAP